MPAGARGEFVAVLLLADSASDAKPEGMQAPWLCTSALRCLLCVQQLHLTLPVLQTGRCGSLLTGGFCAKTCGFCQCPAGESSPAAAPGPSKLTSCSLQCPGLDPQPRELLPLATHTADKHVTRTGCTCDDIPPAQEFGLPENYTCQEVSPATAENRSRQQFCLAGCLPHEGQERFLRLCNRVKAQRSNLCPWPQNSWVNGCASVSCTKAHGLTGPTGSQPKVLRSRLTVPHSCPPKCSAWAMSCAGAFFMGFPSLCAQPDCPIWLLPACSGRCAAPLTSRTAPTAARPATAARSASSPPRSRLTPPARCRQPLQRRCRPPAH